MRERHEERYREMILEKRVMEKLQAQGKKAYIRLYTRETEGVHYPGALAHSVHMAVSTDGKVYEPLNRNYGMLFPEAAISEDNTLLERGLLNPVAVASGSDYFIFGDYVDAEGRVLSPDRILLWTTKDFVDFEEKGLVARTEYAEYLEKAENILAIDLKLLKGITDAWMPLRGVKALCPQEVTAASLQEVSSLKAAIQYSDGSVHEKKVKWNIDAAQRIDENRYKISGEVVQPVYPFPLAEGFADPVIFPWQGSWYFISTNDNTNAVGLFVRKAATVEGLFAPDIEIKCILDYDQQRNLIQTFWAPEFHVIGGALYILFAVGGKEWAPQCHIMKLKEAGDIMNPLDWEAPVRVRRQDGGYLEEGGITLDMTHLRVREKDYYVWSARYGIGTSLDSGSMLYIAPIDEREPWRLAGEPVLLSRPLYGWENQSGTINNEGPYPLVLGDKVYIAFSGGSAGDYSYVVGYLMIDADENLLNASKWKKTCAPVLSSYCFEDRMGTGHNSFYRDEDGNIMIAYHAERPGEANHRCTAIHRVHLNKDGFPVLSMPPDWDLPETLKTVSVEVILQ